MIRRGRAVTALALALCASAAWPASAWAHAALLRTTPQASGTVNGSPAQVTLTYDEAVEPRFAIISVTDAAGRQEIAGSPHALATDPRTLAVALRHARPGLVSRLLAGDLGRRPPRAGRVHVRRGPEPRAGAAVR